jgi:putative transposase
MKPTRAEIEKKLASIVDDGRDLPFKKPVTEETAVGIDLGIKSFIVTSDGKKVDSPKPLKKLLSKLKYSSRHHSKKKKGGKNRKKSQHKLSLLHEKITNQRKDFLHKLSTDLIKNHDTLCLEDLNISGIVKNHKLAQAISDMGWGMFVDFCKYKAEWAGDNILQIPTFEPSSKIHNKCGYHNKELTLSNRVWLCPKCNEMVDRDLNAAINIKNYCLNNRAGVRREKSVEPPALAGAVKQKKCTV